MHLRDSGMKRAGYEKRKMKKRVQKVEMLQRMRRNHEVSARDIYATHYKAVQPAVQHLSSIRIRLCIFRCRCTFCLVGLRWTGFYKEIDTIAHIGLRSDRLRLAGFTAFFL